jgi:hypothetical protein
MQGADYRFEDHGSIWLIHPLSDEAEKNLVEGTADDFCMWWGKSLVVEPRFVDHVSGLLIEEGWIVE